MQEGKMRRQFTWKDERKGLLAYSSCDGLMAKILPMTDNGPDFERAHTPQMKRVEKACVRFSLMAATFRKISKQTKNIYMQRNYTAHI